MPGIDPRHSSGAGSIAPVVSAATCTAQLNGQGSPSLTRNALPAGDSTANGRPPASSGFWTSSSLIAEAIHTTDAVAAVTEALRDAAMANVYLLGVAVQRGAVA